MEIPNEDEKKVNLIKCPLPRIIYTTLNGQNKISKKSLNTSNNNTYYSRKLNNRSPGLPSLKTNNKFSSSPNKTNYINIKMTNNLSNNNNNTKNIINNNTKINKINNNKEIKKPNLKEILNSYGLNKYYDKIIELGLNDDNINNLGYMNKKAFNELISNINMFPGHKIKMEQLYHHLKQTNSGNRQLHNNSNIKNNNNVNNNNNENNNNYVNYVTLSFNRNNNANNIANKIMHSQSHNKYRFINPTIKSKTANSNSNINLCSGKSRVSQHKTNYSLHKNLTKNKSKKKIDNNINNTKTFFELNKPINGGRNILIKFFFKDLSNYVNNMSGIMNNNFNKTNNNNNFNGLTNNININQERKQNDFSNTFNENHLSSINIKEMNPSDLPSINNKIKINTHYNKSLLNSNNPNLINNMNNINNSPKLEIKAKAVVEVNGKNKKIKNSNNEKLDKSKTIHNYQIPYNINAFIKEEFIKNLNNNLSNTNNNNNNFYKNKLNLKENLKNNVILQKTQYENSKKNNKINSILKLKLPNVMNKTDFQNSLSKSKIKQKSAEEKNSQNLNENNNKKQIKEIKDNKDNKDNKENKDNKDNKENNIILKNEKTILKRKNKNEILNNKENQSQKINQNSNTNTVVIQSFDDNKIIEEKKPIRLREHYDNNKNNEIIENNKKEKDNINNIKDKEKTINALSDKNNKEIINNN